MKSTGKIDLHTDAGYRRMTGEDDEVKGYGIRGANLLRKGIKSNGQHAIHLIESVCKSHRLKVRSSYSSETLSAAHGMEDTYLTIVYS